MKERKKKIKQVFLDELPKWEDTENVGKINWKECINYKVKFIYNDIEGEITINNCNGSKLIIQYKDAEFEIETGNFLKCKLGKLLNKVTSDFKIEIGAIFQDDKRDIIITDRTKLQSKNGQIRKYYKYACNKCGFYCREHWSIKDKEYKEELWTEENNLLNGNGCACCCVPSRIVVKGINDINTTTPWMVSYFKNKEDANNHTKLSNEKVEVICPDCDLEKKIVICDFYSNESIGCSCGDGNSYPNKFMLNILKQLNIDFETEYSPDWVNLKSYDFYIPSLNLIIEMDGGFHNRDNNMSGQTKEESKAIDDYKDEQAKLHGMKVIRIDCDYGSKLNERFNLIKYNTLKSKLNKLLNLSIIDWYTVDKFALSNLVKIICEMWNNKEEYENSKDIAKKTGFNSLTIVRWLKKGKEHNLCNYNARLESQKAHSKAGKKNGKPIKIYKDGIILGEFESASELSRQSENLFGVKLSTANISAVCCGKLKHYKGYTFKYINKEDLKEVANF